MKRLILMGALTGALSACAAELMVLPIALVAAPVVAAADAAVVASGTAQPLRVVSASGTELAGPALPETKPAATFKAVSGTVTCSGTAQGAPGWLEAVQIPVRCSNGMRGTAAVEGNLSSGYALRMRVTQGESRGLTCQGYFQGAGRTAGPFAMICGHLRSTWTDFNKTKRELATVGQSAGAGQAGPAGTGQFAIKAWVAPL